MAEKVVNAVRQQVRRALKRFNYDLRRYVSEVGSTLPMLEVAVTAHLAGQPDLFFVQVGANDGIIDDPLQQLVRKHRLRGLLIEPMPDAFARLRANYADQPQLVFENCALWSEAGEREFYRIRPGAYADPKVNGMAGFSREKLLASARFLPGLAGNIETLRVVTATTATVLAKHGIARVDLLLVDTEGFDDQIIQQVFSAGVSPAIVHYEHIHLTPARQDACCQFLSRAGYRFTRTRTDTLAMRWGDPPAPDVARGA
jgi:FkbM family methyltransferase